VKSKWLSRILFLSAGIVIGIIIASSFIINATKNASALVSLSSRAWESDQAMHAYLNDKPEIAAYALNHFISVLQPFYDDKNKDEFPEATAQDLAFAYIRLGNISKFENKPIEAEPFYNKGYTIYKRYCSDSAKEVPSREMLVELINKLDARAKSKKH
jgi:alanine-alpha-ketoisovalerate/valine-pyruvate aminotransferase